ncbi:MAG: ABC transporter substrate-binding protein [Thermoprotei archaeon]|jgi:branched-chain amino acid transport system substrate-binding protein
MAQRKFLIIAMLLLVLIIGYAGNKVSAVNQPVNELSGTIKLGALLPLTGDLASYGQRAKVAVQMAQDDINNYVTSKGMSVKFEFVIEDTQTKPDVALQKLQELNALGVKATVGPMTSAEVRNLLSYATSNKILMVSPSSTAAALAVPNRGYLYRTVTTDLFQDRAIAKMITHFGYKYVVVLYRGDAWGDGIAEDFPNAFAKEGGTVVNKIRYDPNTKDFTNELSTLNTYVTNAINTYGKNNVAVLTVSFDEAATILNQAKSYSTLMSVKWFGTDGTADITKILTDAGDTASIVGLYSTIFTPAASTKLDQFISKFKAIAGQEPDSYSIISYDSAWLIALAVIQAGVYDGEQIKNLLPTVAQSYEGVSGKIVFDQYGDRASGDYKISYVVKDPTTGNYKWVVYGIWHYDTDTITVKITTTTTTVMTTTTTTTTATGAGGFDTTTLAIIGIIVIVVIAGVAYVVLKKK